MICTIGRAHYARPASPSEDMRELIQLFAQIALLRRGPQDLPASTLLLALTVIGYLAVMLVVTLFVSILFVLTRCLFALARYLLTFIRYLRSFSSRAGRIGPISAVVRVVMVLFGATLASSSVSNTDTSSNSTCQTATGCRWGDYSAASPAPATRTCMF